MSRGRCPLTPQQLAEIREAAKRGPDGRPLAETMRTTIEGTATAPETAARGATARKAVTDRGWPQGGPRPGAE